MPRRGDNQVFITLPEELDANEIARRTAESWDWFRRTIVDRYRYSSFKRKQVIQNDPYKLITKPYAGQVLSYLYNPKYAKKLPYYDRMPLIVYLSPDELYPKEVFHGINLHYLPPILRSKLFQELLKKTRKVKEGRRIRVTYEYLKETAKLKEFYPCYKKYRRDHMHSRPAMVPEEHWDIAIFLPLAVWTKERAKAVYMESRQMIKDKAGDLL